MSKPNRIMFIDLETNNNQYFGAIASPRHPDNYVVMVGQAIDSKPFNGEITGNYYYSKDEAKDWLHIPDSVWLLVAHNAPYELDWMQYQQRPEIEKFLKRGGRVFCTAYAHYLLSNQQDTYPALGEIAVKYGGTPKVDGIKILWEQGVLTKDIDKDLLSEYLLGPSGDIDNTRRVFWGQYKQLVARGMWKGALARMEGMLFCAAAMDNGLYVNRDVAFAQMEIGNNRLNLLVESFKKWRAGFPDDAAFKEGSAFHMSAWIYGGPLKYKSRRPYSFDGSPEQYVKDDFYKFGTAKHPGPRIAVSKWEALSPEQQCDAIMDDGELIKFSAGKNKGMPKVFREDTNEVKLKWFDLVHECPGIARLDLLPDSLKKEFDNEFTGKRKLADGSPVYSTAKDPLEVLSKRNEFPADVRDVLGALLEFAKLDKDLGTYYLREECDDEGNVIKQAGMLQYLNDISYVHHNLNMTATVTTRLSSNKPNFQNLPRGGTSDVKKMFTSRFGDDGFIVEADYSALEVVTLAAFSKDKALTKALLDNIDMHCMRLSAQLGEPYEDVLKKCKDQKHPEHEKYDRMRTDIKPKAFSYQYGATAFGIAFSTGCSVEEAQAFIDTEKALFPDVEAFYEDEIFPKVEASTKRHREEVDGTWRIYGVGTWTAPGGTSYEFRQWPKTVWHQGQKSFTMQYKPTQMRNYPIQGESGFFVQGVCGLVYRWLLERDFFRDADGNPKVYIINTVHDAIYLDCHKDVLDEVCENVKRIMESLPTYFEETLGYDLGVPFPAAVEFGVSMYHKVHWHKGVLDEPATHATLVKHRAELVKVVADAELLRAA
uniref:DNA polymerase n=4 Tax=unclassified bacterial viruses TaxID=12333 RepID=A0AAU6W0E2_9VIRU